MIICRTPFRVSFFGGGTDYPAWYRRHGGAVLGTTIDKYCYISLRYLPPFFDYAGRIVYSKIELFRDVSEIQHPVVREGLKMLGPLKGVALHHEGDLPAKTGLGSSSTFTVCLLHSLHALRGTMPTKMDLTRQAIHLEQNVLKESVGSQDQTLAAHGGFNRIDFAPDDGIRISPMIMQPERLAELQDHLMLWFTGFSRFASEIAVKQIETMDHKEREIKIMRQMVDQAQEILTGSGDLTAFGELLHGGWMLKRSLTDRISTPEIDRIYELARGAGAIGGKLLGAGGGGFVLLFVRPEKRESVKKALSGFLNVPFQFERQGSQIVHYEPERPEDDPATGCYRSDRLSVSRVETEDV
jgi:D-glycero-alpha-D-manno-heptose-7-phosphate kinase